MYLDVDSDKQVNKQRKSWNDIIEVAPKKLLLEPFDTLSLWYSGRDDSFLRQMLPVNSWIIKT